jgi:hypothetical protein
MINFTGELLMKKSCLLKTVIHCILAYCMCALSPSAHAHLFTANGSLSTPDGIDGLGSWGTGLTTMNWDVNHPDGCCESFYTYTFEHPEANTFELIIEVHPDMVTNNFGVEIYDVFSTLPNYELGFFSPSTSFPGMPDTIPGVRFWGDSGSTTETISFTSDYLPMWGDFYATDANAIATAWNTGFTNLDTDANDNFHIMVPGAGGIPIIPIPAAVWLFGSGLLGLVGIARRRKAPKQPQRKPRHKEGAAPSPCSARPLT